MLMASMNTSIANAGLPTLAQAFRASFSQVQWIVLAYLLVITALIVGVGRLGDIMGRRRLLLGGIALFTVASVGGAVANSLGGLIAVRAVQGLGSAIMMALALAFVGETVPKERTGKAMGLLGTMSAIGTALGPSLGGALISGLGWQAIFLVNVPLGGLTLVLAYRCLPGDRVEKKADVPSFDMIGTILLALTLAAYALAMTGRNGFGPVNAALLAGAAVLSGLFVRVERRATNPLLRLGMFRDRELSGSLVMSGLVSTVMMSTLVVGPFYLTRAIGLNAGVVGIILSVGPVVAALTGVPAGHLADRFGAQRVTAAGLGVIAVGSVLLSLMPTEFGVSGYVFPIAVLTAGYALFQTSNNSAVMSGVALDQRGVVSGLLNLSRNLGLVTGASVMGAVFALATGAGDVLVAPPQSVATGMRVTFAVAAALIGVALAIAFGTRTATSRRSTAIGG
jgi:EmrB/QacA subfamily drug resistance transporter